MGIRTRKLVGTVAILMLLALYLPLAMLVGANHFAHAATLWQIAYFLVAGVIWVIPAGLLIRWMARPDAEGPR